MQCILLALSIFLAVKSCVVRCGSASVQLHLTDRALALYANQSSGSNTAYFGVLTIGTPPQQFLGCYDTGSSDVWVPSSDCNTAACSKHNTYDPSSSSTAKATSTAFRISYTTETATGTVMNDTMSIGDLKLSEQSFGSVNETSQNLQSVTCDGIIGLGFTALSQINSPSPFFNMLSQGVLDSPLFSLWLSAVPNEESAGELIFGGTNDSRYSTPTHFIDVPTNSYWAIPIDDIDVDGTGSGLTATTAIIDSGSSANFLSQSDANALHKLIPEATYWEEAGVWNISGTCQNLADLPSLTLVFQGEQFDIRPLLWVIKYRGACISSFIPSNNLLPGSVIIGTPFLRAWHAQFSYDSATRKAQIGFSSPVNTATSSVFSVSQTSSVAVGRKLLRQNTRGLLSPLNVTEEFFFSAHIPNAKERGIV